MDRPLVWSRRNGPWHRVPILWVGAAPGNAGGLGSGDLGAHGTRIPFGGDVAGANLDVLFSSIGITRNDTFIVASLNRLPAKGGGEPTTRELAEPVGRYFDSAALLRDTVIAAGPALIVTLGIVGLRTLVAALTRDDAAPPGAPSSSLPPLRLPTQARLAAAGLQRGVLSSWPAAFPLAAGFARAWRDAREEEPGMMLLPLMHPSAQNMSPYAREGTLFHTRMLETREALVAGARTALGIVPPRRRPALPRGGIYALPEWRDRIAERHERLDALWRARGV